MFSLPWNQVMTKIRNGVTTQITSLAVIYWWLILEQETTMTMATSCLESLLREVDVILSQAGSLIPALEGHCWWWLMWEWFEEWFVSGQVCVCEWIDVVVRGYKCSLLSFSHWLRHCCDHTVWPETMRIKCDTVWHILRASESRGVWLPKQQMVNTKQTTFFLWLVNLTFSTINIINQMHQRHLLHQSPVWLTIFLWIKNCYLIDIFTGRLLTISNFLMVLLIYKRSHFEKVI